MKVKVESEKVGLKLNIQKTKIMASGPITSWEIDGETMETVADFILGGSKITADGDYNHEIKRRLLLVLCLVPQSCPILHDPMDCSPPCSSVYGDSPGKNTGIGYHTLLQGIFLTKGWNPGLLNCRQFFTI